MEGKGRVNGFTMDNLILETNKSFGSCKEKEAYI